MEKDTVFLTDLYDMMEREVESYEALSGIMEREWECLKKADTSSLLSLLQDKECHISRIKSIHESIEHALTGVASSLSDLMPRVSSPHAQKIRDYRIKVHRLKDRISRANEQNRLFVQETLNSLNEFFCLLIPSGQGDPVYSNNGRKTVPESSLSWMSRRI